MTTKTFIERPVLSAVISILIALLGIIGLRSLPIEQYPDIAPPTVMVMTQYFGASAESVQKSVIAPLEEAINGVENMTYMTSTATNNGSVEIYVYFKQGTNPDMAAVNVQNKIASATSQLPTEVKVVGVQAFKRQTSMLQIFTVSSPDDTFDENFLSNYININIKPELLRIQGVGQMVVLGGTYSMRVWMDPERMAQYHLVPSDVTAALAEQNIESATGAIGEHSEEAYQYTMKYTGRLQTPEEFGQIVIRSTADGEVLRLRDIAKVELGIDSYAYHGRQNGHEGVQCMVFQTAGSNATEVNNQIDALLAKVQQNAPKGVKITQMMSSNEFLYASIRGVIVTLIEAIVLVILIVLLFLQDWRSTLIPLLSILVSIIGSFACMVAFKFSINLITLFGLVLVIGTVVDNSIVIVEAVQSRFEQGMRSPFQAAVYGTKDVALAIITSTIVFMAVFIPVSFMGGTSGVFYKEFGLTMAAAVGISAVNALTLCPALCALILRPKTITSAEGLKGYALWKYRFSEKWNTGLARLTKGYQKGADGLIRRPGLAFGIAAVAIVGMVVLMRYTKTGLVPEEDKGTVMINVDTKPGSGLETTNDIMLEIEKRLKTIPEVEEMYACAGYGLITGESTAAGNLILKLKPWSERTHKGQDVNAVIGKVYALTADIKDATVFAMAPAMINGYGTGNNLDINLQDKMGGDLDQFVGYAGQFIGALNQRPEIKMAFTSFNNSFPQWEVSVDAAKCQRSGVTANEVLGCLAGYYGGQYVSDFNRFGKVYKVFIQGDPTKRTDERSLDNTFVRLHNGEMAPLSQFVTLRKVYGANSLTRFNMYNSIAVSAMPADGYSSGDAIRAVKEVAAETLPQQYAVDFGGITREESQTSNSGTMAIFLICLVLIYLILCALYESFYIPLAIIVAVPVGLMGSFLFTKIFGLENNIYLQTGVIMLIGLLSKTAILITEFAVERHKEGKSLRDAALEAAGARLRPILMTVLTLIFGMLPLVVSTGVGANGNRSLGTGVVGGSIIGTLALLYLVPAFYVFFQKRAEKNKHARTLILMLPLIAICSGCGIYGKYKPVTNLEAARTDSANALFREGLHGSLFGDAALSDTASCAALTDWQTLFTDPLLRQHIETVLGSGYDMQVAQEHVKQLDAALLGAKLAYLPSIGLAPNVGYWGQMQDGMVPYQLVGQASWEIDIFGRTLNSLRKSKAAAKQMRDVEQATRAGLICGTANAYFTLEMLDAQLRIAEQTDTAWQQTVSVIRKMKEAGMANEAAAAQLEATWYAIQTTCVDLRQQIREVENGICLLEGKPAGTHIERGQIDDACNLALAGREMQIGLPAQLLHNRPDVRAAEHNLEQAFYATNYARSSCLPSLSISAVIGYGNYSNGSMFPAQMLYNLAASLFVPIFQSGRNIAQVRMAKSQQEEALQTFCQTVLAAGNEVNDQVYLCEANAKKVTLYGQQVEALTRAEQSTRLLMQYGNTTYLEVLTAENTLLTARLQLVATKMQQLQSTVALWQALGGGAEFND